MILSEKLKINTEQAPHAQLKSHAKLFSKFVNIGKSSQQQQQAINESSKVKPHKEA